MWGVYKDCKQGCLVVDINSIFNQNMITCYNLDKIITFLWEKGITFGTGEIVFEMIASLRENLKNEVRLFNVLKWSNYHTVPQPVFTSQKNYPVTHFPFVCKKNNNQSPTWIKSLQHSRSGSKMVLFENHNIWLKAEKTLNSLIIISIINNQLFDQTLFLRNYKIFIIFYLRHEWNFNSSVFSVTGAIKNGKSK